MIYCSSAFQPYDLCELVAFREHLMPGREYFEFAQFTKYSTSEHFTVAFASSCLAFTVVGASGSSQDCSFGAEPIRHPFDHAYLCHCF